MTTRIAVLASGGGSNLQAILEHFDTLADSRAGDVALVVSNRNDAGALARARSRAIETAVVAAPQDGNDGGALAELLTRHDIALVALAGYLRLVPPDVVRAYTGRIVNVHPALLPGFGGPGMYGPRVHQAVLDAGAKITGVTVHFVDEIFDSGRIIAQWPAPVLEGDTAATLAERVLRIEHLLYPRVVHALAAHIGRPGAPAPSFAFPVPAAFVLASHDERCLTDAMDRALSPPRIDDRA